MPARLAIVDVAPREQFLYPEFELYAQAFRERGVDSVIRAPEALSLGPQGLQDAHGQIDTLYNRLTDFALADPGHAPLQKALSATRDCDDTAPQGACALRRQAQSRSAWRCRSPGGLGVDAATAERLAQVIPSTVQIAPENRAALWADRDRYFFKPASGFGSRGSYRGDKLTRRVWGHDGIGAPTYWASRHRGEDRARRCLAESRRALLCIRGGVLLFAARLYQGADHQHAYARGGFAAVLTSSATAA